METPRNNAFDHCKTPWELYDAIEGVLRPAKDSQSRKKAKLDQTRHYGIFFKGDGEYYGQDGKLFDKRTLEEVHLPLDPVPTYEDARTCAITFRKLCPMLPTLPSHNANAVAGLQEMAEWCIVAIDVVDHMVDHMDRKVIDGFIRNLNKLKGLPASGFPKIHKDVWKKAENRAQRICDKYQTREKKRPRGLDALNYCSKRTRFIYSASIISSLADVADRKAGRPDRWPHLLSNSSLASDTLSKRIEEAHTEMYFYRAVEKIYRLMDSDYNAAVAKLEERIFLVFKEWNKLNATDTGDLLDKYDELKGLKLQDRVVRLARAYSIDSLADTALFGSVLPQMELDIPGLSVSE